MQASRIVQALAGTEITMAEDRAVPINGAPVPLPYFVIRREETETGADNGLVGVTEIHWTVALFTAKSDFALECKIKRALWKARISTIEVERFPDGTPYQTNFEFSTKTIRKD